VHQPYLFGHLVPDEALRGLISRNHFELAWRQNTLWLRKMSANALLLDGLPVAEQASVSQGSQIGFCCLDGKTPFILFTILYRELKNSVEVAACFQQQGHQNARQSLVVPRPSTSQASYALTCVYAQGMDLATIPMELKKLNIFADQRNIIGRTHQQTFFEGILGKEHPFLSYISRQHFEINPIAGKPGECEVTNLSANPIIVGSQQLQRSKECRAQPPVDIGIVAGAQGTTAHVFVRLSLEMRVPEDAPAPAGQGGCVAIQPTRPSQGNPSAKLPHFELELGGSAVKDNFPDDRRCLAGGCSGLVVGRALQQQLHSLALKDGVMQFISREHFRIESVEELYQLTPLSANLMWLLRGGVCTEVRKGQPPVVLAHNDKILLFTGATDATPDGMGSKGTLWWRFALTKQQSGCSSGAPSRSSEAAQQRAPTLVGEEDPALLGAAHPIVAHQLPELQQTQTRPPAMPQQIQIQPPATPQQMQTLPPATPPMMATVFVPQGGGVPVASPTLQKPEADSSNIRHVLFRSDSKLVEEIAPAIRSMERFAAQPEEDEQDVRSCIDAGLSGAACQMNQVYPQLQNRDVVDMANFLSPASPAANMSSLPAISVAPISPSAAVVVSAAPTTPSAADDPVPQVRFQWDTPIQPCIPAVSQQFTSGKPIPVYTSSSDNAR